MFSKLIHVTGTSSVFMTIIFRCMASLHFICLSVDGHWGCFYFVTIVNNASVNIHIQLFVCMCVSGSLGYIPSRIAKLYGNSV